MPLVRSFATALALLALSFSWLGEVEHGHDTLAKSLVTTCSVDHGLENAPEAGGARGVRRAVPPHEHACTACRIGAQRTALGGPDLDPRAPTLAVSTEPVSAFAPSRDDARFAWSVRGPPSI